MANMTLSAALAEQDELSALVRRLRELGAQRLARKVVTVMSAKGGIGKTFVAMELAWLLDAVLVDLDWDDGNASTALGQHHDRFARIPLLDALETEKPPRPKRSGRRPDLVPCHPRLRGEPTGPPSGWRNCFPAGPRTGTGGASWPTRTPAGRTRRWARSAPPTSS